MKNVFIITKLLNCYGEFFYILAIIQPIMLLPKRLVSLHHSSVCVTENCIQLLWFLNFDIEIHIKYFEKVSWCGFHLKMAHLPAKLFSDECLQIVSANQTTKGSSFCGLASQCNYEIETIYLNASLANGLERFLKCERSCLRQFSNSLD